MHAYSGKDNTIANNNDNSFHSINCSIATSEDILSQSYGEVTNSICINKTSDKPIVNSLFCPKIFGPMNPYQCLCDKPLINELSYCKTCGVDFNIDNTAARSRFGHIQLAVPVVHVLYYKSIPNIISTLLDMPSNIIEGIINCELHIIAKPSTDEFKASQIINSETYKTLWESKIPYEILSGGYAILKLLSKINPNECKPLLENNDNSRELNNRLNLIKKLVKNKISPTDLIIKVLPVMPAVLRPLIPIDNDDYTNSSLNELYNHIIDANNNISINLNSFANKDNNDIDF